jgi:hypothetical protein
MRSSYNFGLLFGVFSIEDARRREEKSFYQNVNSHRKLIKTQISGRMFKNAREIAFGETKIFVLY